jgi:MFS family permease
MRVVRSRGALSGFLLLLLGLWGALIPFVGPYFHYAYTPDSAWSWTAGRFWLELLPGIAAAVAGLMLMVTANRSVGVFAGWLASLAGAWFLVGPVLGRLWNGAEGAAGSPVGGTARQVWEQIGFFSGLGAVILFLGALALGRFTVTSIRDIRAAERARTPEPAPAAAGTPVRDDKVAEPTREVQPVRAEPTREVQPVRAEPVAVAGGRHTRSADVDGSPATRPAEPMTRPVEDVTRPQGAAVRTEDTGGTVGGATRNDALDTHRRD